jgi:hypothetical protein
MRNIEKVIILIAAMSPALIFGQYSETLVSDRPGQTMSPNTVGKKVLQFQFGYTFSDFEEDNKNLSDKRGAVNREDRLSNIFNLKTRYGIWERTEISVDLTASYFDANYERESSASNENNNYGANGYNYLFGAAVRQNFIRNTETGFNLGAELQFFGTYSYSSEYNFDALLIVAANKQLGEKFSIAGNAGLTLYDLDFYFTCNLGYSLTDKLGVYAEYFPLFSNDSRLSNEKNLRMTNSFVNTGCSYLISPNFMLDLSGGFMVSDYNRSDNTDISEYSIQFGFTSRLGSRK